MNIKENERCEIAKNGFGKHMYSSLEYGFPFL
jgi:hypothetical protein